MKNGLLAIAVGLGAIGVFYAGAQGGSDVEIREEAADSFDLRPADLPMTRVAITVPEPMRDAVAAMPVAAPAAGAAFARPAQTPAAAAAAMVKAPQPRAATAAEKASYTALLASPARYLASKTLLGRPGQFAQMVQRKDFGKAYVQSPVVRAVLESPTAVKAVLSNQTLVRAFLESPALRDPRAVTALGDSALLQYVLTSSGVQKALSDPVVYNQVFMSPQTLSWVASSPQAQATMGKLTQALAR